MFFAQYLIDHSYIPVISASGYRFSFSIGGKLYQYSKFHTKSIIIFYQYCNSNIELLSIATHIVIAFSTLLQQQMALLISLLNFSIGPLLLFCIAFHIYSQCSFSILKVTAKSKVKSNNAAIYLFASFFALAFFYVALPIVKTTY